jgi:hypothetical protein
VEVFFWFVCRSLYLIHGASLCVPHIYGTLFLCMLIFKSPSLAFLVLARILCVLNKFHFSFKKKTY